MTLFGDLDTYLTSFLTDQADVIAKYEAVQAKIASFVYLYVFPNQAAYSVYSGELAIHEAALTVLDNLYAAALEALDDDRFNIVTTIPLTDTWFLVDVGGVLYGVSKTAAGEMLLCAWTATSAVPATATAAAHITGLHPAGGVVGDEGTATAAGVVPVLSGAAGVTGVVTDAPAAGIAPVVTGSP